MPPPCPAPAANVRADLWFAARRWPASFPAGPTPTAEETARLAGMANQEVRARSHDASLLLGHLAAEAAGREPSSIRVGRQANGAPMVDPPMGLQCGISHTREWIAAAVTCGSPVGIDVETVRPLRPATRDAFLIDAESAAIADDPAGAVALWCLKEEWPKALGAGLRRDPRDAWFALSPDGVTCGGGAAGWSAEIRVLDRKTLLAVCAPAPYRLRFGAVAGALGAGGRYGESTPWTPGAGLCHR